MPLRDLYYVAEELKKIMAPAKLYGTRMVKVPTPRFIVFYNGTDYQPAEKVMRLSDMYEVQTGTPELELIVRQVNINPGFNDDILEKCESLKGYMTFVDKVRTKTGNGRKVDSAVAESVDECIEEGVLAGFFRRNRDKVIEMGIFEYDAELHDKVLREESFEEGKAEGKAEAIIELLEGNFAVPEDVRSVIMSQTNLEVLKAWLKAAAKAESLAEWKRIVEWESRHT